MTRLGEALWGQGRGWGKNFPGWEKGREAGRLWHAKVSVLDESFFSPPVLRNLMLFLGTCWT